MTRVPLARHDDVATLPAEPLIDALRRRTRPHHQRIEELLALQSDFDRAWYGRVVRGFDSFLAGWEPRVRAALTPALQPWFDGRARGALARRDLARLGIERDAASAPLPLQLPSLCAALGSLYVMEGSALGGQVIVRHVKNHLGIAPEHGAAYFDGARERTGPQWREFLQMLARHDEEGCDHDAACDAAAGTFDALHAHFRRVLHAGG